MSGPTDREGRSLLLTVGPMLPITVVAVMMRALDDAFKESGFTDVGITGGLQVWGRMPELGRLLDSHDDDEGRGP